MNWDKIVRDAYKNYLGRDTPDTEGLNWWVEQLSTGALSVDALEESMKAASTDWNQTADGIWVRHSDTTDVVTDEGVVIDNRQDWQKLGYVSGKDWFDAGSPVANDGTVRYTPTAPKQDPINFDDIKMTQPDSPAPPSPPTGISQFEALVRSAYNDVLLRPNPDQSGINFWVEHLNSGTLNPETLSGAMLEATGEWEQGEDGSWVNKSTGASAEDETYIVASNVSRSNAERFVRNQYASLFDRHYPEQAGVDEWVNKLLSGEYTMNTLPDAMKTAGERWITTRTPGEWYNIDTGDFVYDERPPVDSDDRPVIPGKDLPDPGVPGSIEPGGPDTPIEEVFEPPMEFEIPDWFENFKMPDFSAFLKPREFTFDKTTPQDVAMLSAPVLGGERDEERKRRASAKSKFKVPLTGVQI